MCDERTLREMDEYLHGTDTRLSRREFGALVVGAGVAATLPRPANALAVTDSMVEVETPEGTAEAHFVHPGEGRHPGVLIWPDAYGLRPALKQMAGRLAESGYAVLTPNQYYRSTRLPALPEAPDLRDPETRERWSALRAPLTAEAVTRDAVAYVGYLDAQQAVDAGRRMGSIGYCMGGSMTLRTAAAMPDRIGAGASFHGGGLVTDRPDSPHRLVAQIKAQYLIAIAENDDKAQPEAKDALREAFDAAGLPAEIEVYAGALHGWCPPDSRVYNEAQAERAWSRLLALFAAALGGSPSA